MTILQITAYLEMAQIAIAAGVALGRELKDIAVQIATLFNVKPLTEDELNTIVSAAKVKAIAIKAQAEADAAQARIDAGK